MANTFPVADTAGVVEQVWRLGQEAGYCDVQPGRRRHRRPGGQAARRAGRDGRLRRRGPGLLRRRQVRRRRGDHAPRAGVREGLRRRRRPARPGAAADRGRPDERGRGLRRARPGGLARGRRGVDHRPRRAARRARRLPACTSATCPRPGSVEIVRWAKSKGWHVTAEVTPHHLLLTDELVRAYDPVYKVNPPLRTEADVEALREALADGTIDCVATDHAPHPVEDKETSGRAAAMGMIGLETALSVVQEAMVDTGLLDWAGVADRMSVAPRAHRPAGRARPAHRGRRPGQPHPLRRLRGGEWTRRATPPGAATRPTRAGAAGPRRRHLPAGQADRPERKTRVTPPTRR